MEVASLRIGIAAEDAQTSAYVREKLIFAGVEPTPIQEAHVILLVGERGINEVPAGRPVIFVGSDCPRQQNVIAEIPELSYHQLLGALHEAATILRDQLTAENPPAAVFGKLIGRSARMMSVRTMLDRAARSDVSVLLTGETGVGKECAARLMHQASARAEHPFVPVRCQSIPEELLEGELFGYVQGAFPGAVTPKSGRMQLAGKGILFLDGVNQLPYHLQVKLLRVLEEGVFSPMGSAESVPFEARLVSAAPAELDSLVHGGEFREDLYQRISVMPVEIAPLRERAEDIIPLIDTFAAEIEQHQNITLRLSVDVIELLAKYNWPTNTRELKHLLERLSMQFPNEVVTTRDLPQKFQQQNSVNELPPAQAASNGNGSIEHQPEDVRLPVNGIDLKDYLARLERSLIEQALDDAGAVVARAADRLHIRRTTLVEKMRKYGISRA